MHPWHSEHSLKDAVVLESFTLGKGCPWDLMFGLGIDVAAFPSPVLLSTNTIASKTQTATHIGILS